MQEQQKRSPDELLQLQEEYTMRFREVLTSRGLAANSPETTEAAAQMLGLHAEVDDDDGEIELPDHLSRVLAAHYKGEEFIVADLHMGKDGVSLTTEPLMQVALPGISDANDFIVHGGELLHREVIFDISQKRYFTGSRGIDEPSFTFSGDQMIETTRWEEHPMTPEILQDLGRLVNSVDQRVNSTIEIHRMQLS